MSEAAVTFAHRSLSGQGPFSQDKIFSSGTCRLFTKCVLKLPECFSRWIQHFKLITSNSSFCPYLQTHGVVAVLILDHMVLLSPSLQWGISSWASYGIVHSIPSSPSSPGIELSVWHSKCLLWGSGLSIFSVASLEKDVWFGWRPLCRLYVDSSLSNPTIAVGTALLVVRSPDTGESYSRWVKIHWMGWCVLLQGVDMTCMCSLCSGPTLFWIGISVGKYQLCHSFPLKPF